MLIYIDESGDPGFKFENGSSKYFTMSLVVFNDNTEASACNTNIMKLLLNLPKDIMDEADIFIDEISNRYFINRLSKYLRKNININKERIRKIKMQRSESNNL